MSETRSQLTPHADLLNQLSAVATALELGVGELILLAGLHDAQLAKMARVTVDGRFEAMSLTTVAPSLGSPLHTELARRGFEFACIRTEKGRAQWLELTATSDELHASVWRFEPSNFDGEVGYLESTQSRAPIRRVGTTSDELGVLLGSASVTKTVRQLLVDIHPLLARGAESTVVCDSERSTLAISYRDVATSDALRVLATLGDAPEAGDKLGRLCGTAGARQIDVLEITVGATLRPRLRFGVELVGANSSGAS